MKEAKRSGSGFSHRDSHKSKKTFSGRSFFDKQLNSEYSPSAKLIFLGIAFTAILIGGFVLSQGPLFHSYTIQGLQSRNDPSTPLWKDNFVNGNAASWQLSTF